MFDHIGLRVKDLAASTRFYEQALAPLGHVLCARDESSAAFGPPEQPALYLYAHPRGASAHTHVALRADSRKAVRAFYQRGLELGGKDHGPPGLRADYAADYYAAFLLDPDGNNLEAVCLKPE